MQTSPDNFSKLHHKKFGITNYSDFNKVLLSVFGLRSVGCIVTFCRYHKLAQTTFKTASQKCDLTFYSGFLLLRLFKTASQSGCTKNWYKNIQNLTFCMGASREFSLSFLRYRSLTSKIHSPLFTCLLWGLQGNFRYRSFATAHSLRKFPLRFLRCLLWGLRENFPYRSLAAARSLRKFSLRF